MPLRLTGHPDVELSADCSRCFALCCSALGFERSSDFAHTKPAGEACAKLADDFSCTIHARLRPSGYRGCTAFDCLGAGQQVSQQTFQGRSWREDGDVKSRMFAAFPVVRELHEVLWYLDEAAALEASTGVSGSNAAELELLITETVHLASGSADQLALVDLGDVRRRVGAVLAEVSSTVRARVGGRRLPRRIAPGADLLGADLAGTSLRGGNLRGACLIAANLEGADLDRVDLLGADLRDARLHAADLSGALFLTPMQVSAAAGDARTKLPARIEQPHHWLT